MPIWRQIHVNCNCIGTHRHRSRQSSANRRTFVHVIFELVYYRGIYQSVSTEDDSDTAKSVRPSGANPLPIHRQYSANAVQTWCHSNANAMSIKSQSSTIECQSCANLKPNHKYAMRIPSESDVNPMRQSDANQVSAHSNRIPILCQYDINSLPICADLTSIPCQSDTNTVPIRFRSMQIWLQSNANFATIWCQPNANPVPSQRKARSNRLSIHPTLRQFHLNPVPILA